MVDELANDRGGPPTPDNVYPGSPVTVSDFANGLRLVVPFFDCSSSSRRDNRVVVSVGLEDLAGASMVTLATGTLILIIY